MFFQNQNEFIKFGIKRIKDELKGGIMRKMTREGESIYTINWRRKTHGKKDRHGGDARVVHQRWHAMDRMSWKRIEGGGEDRMEKTG